MWRTVGRPKQDAAVPQLVAVDSDKNSHNVLKWAADHVIPRGLFFVLLHVRPKVTTISAPTGSQLLISEVEEGIASTYLEQINLRTKELLLPFQCFCSRRGVNQILDTIWRLLKESSMQEEDLVENSSCLECAMAVAPMMYLAKKNIILATHIRVHLHVPAHQGQAWTAREKNILEITLILHGNHRFHSHKLMIHMPVGK